MEKKILITGATGTIGKELVRELEKRGVCFRIALRDITNSRFLNNTSCPVVLLDYKNPRTFFAALDGISDLFLATPISYPNLEELIVPVLENAKKTGVKHVVSLGAVGVDQSDDSPLSIAEKCVQGCGLTYTILRPNFIMQNFLPLISLINANKGKMELPVGYAKVSLVDAEDIASTIAESLLDLKHANKIYCLTGDQSLDFFEIAHIISRITLRTITYIPVNHNEAQHKMQLAGWNHDQIRVMTGLFEIIHQGWCEKIKPDLKLIIGREANLFENFVWKYRDYWNLK
jgi:uncharacterized protein YbjT (DUF2867 family)